MLVIVLSTPAPVSARDANIVEIRRTDAACLLKHRTDYLKTAQDLLFIKPERCPDVRSSLSVIQSGATNSGPSENPSSRIIVIERRQLGCFFDRLAALQRSNGAATLRVNIGGCPK
ncbi:hypothetical protein [Caulobacter mirabilis]|nr:hypothetical protein [Caulobacter mirabilis]